jgi:hypothetical protein
MGKRYLYDSGLPFDGPINKNLDQCIHRVEKKGKASCIIIDGIPGNGKTTLLVHMLDYINKQYGKPEAALDLHNHPQLSMGGNQFVEYLRLGKKEGIVILGYDEAGDFDRRDFKGKFNRMLNNIFQRYRGFRIILILALPNFNVLETRLFQYGVPRMLYHCHDKSENQAEYSAYSLVTMNWIRYWFKKLPEAINYMCYSKVEPNFRGHFLDLTPDRSKQLDVISTKSKEDLTIQAEIQMDGLLTYTQMMPILNRGLSWVRQTANKLKIKPVKTEEKPYPIPVFGPVLKGNIFNEADEWMIFADETNKLKLYHLR